LLFFPALLIVRAPRRLWLLVGPGMVFMMLCLTQRQSTRFVLSSIGPMAVGVAWLAHYWLARRALPARLLIGMLVLVAAFEASLAVARARHGLTVVVGRESAERYLLRREPTYRVARWVGDHLPADARLIGQDHRAFYFPRPYTMELAHRRRTGLGTRGEPAATIVEELRKDGFTHLLICPPTPLSAVEFDPTLLTLLDDWLEARAPLYRADVTDPDGVSRRYAIYALEGAQASGRQMQARDSKPARELKHEGARR
jgi:hypothetical protein